mmetsp:Transcript_937/g.2963  ORF Transcript_937/g.2963 Transcript_937/m.2963 type:complete len:884 (-) Transcript_937:581-3232(-)
MMRLPSAMSPSSDVSGDKFEPILSHKLKKVGGHSLKSWLVRRGKSFKDLSSADNDKEEIRNVFQLFEVPDNPGFFPSESFVVACRMLKILQDPRLLPPLPPLLTFREFEDQLKKLGYGKRDILVELYNPETMKWLEETRTLLNDGMPASLQLLHMRRQRSIQSLPMSDAGTSEDANQSRQPAPRPRRDSSYVSASKTSPSDGRLSPKRTHTEIVVIVLFGKHNPSNVFSQKKISEVSLQLQLRDQSERTLFKKVGPNMTWYETFTFRFTSDSSLETSEKLRLSLVCKELHSQSIFTGDPVALNARKLESKERWIKLECRSVNYDTCELCLSFRRLTRLQLTATSSDRSSDMLDRSATSEGPSSAVLDDVAEEIDERLRRLIAWEEGDKIVLKEEGQAHQSSSNIFLPPGQSLRALCSRVMPIYSEPDEVAAKLRTNFAREFQFNAWSSERRKESLKTVQDKLRNLTSLKFLSYLHTNNKDHAVTQFVKLAIAASFCLALDESGNIHSWGDSKVKGPMNLMLKEYDDKVIERMINKYFSKKEEEDPDPDQQRARIKQRNDDWEMYLQNKGEYVCMMQSRPFMLKSMQSIFVFDVAVGVSHCAALSREGHVYTWGCGDYGKLGHGGLWDVAQPRQVQALNKRRCIQIACGANHTLALTDNSMLWTWGDGRYGQLGHGTWQDCGLPCKVLNPESARQEHLKVRWVGCGDDFTAAITSENRMLTWGNGWHGQLGHERMVMGGEAARRKRSDVDQFFSRVPSLSLLTQTKQDNARGSAARTRSNAEDSKMQEILNRLKVYEGKMRCNLGYSPSSSTADDGRARARSLPQQVHLLRDVEVSKIACGSRHVLAYSADPPRVWSWGEGEGNKLGHGTCFDQYEPSEMLLLI